MRMDSISVFKKQNKMKKLVSLIAVIALFVPALLNAQELTAVEIVKKADDKMRGLSSKGEMTMQIVRSSWTRTISMKTWSKSDQYSLILITAPAKEKGQVFLKRKKEMWNWVPSIERMVKIPPSMMMQSWMGSDFSNDDLVRQSSIVRDYEHKLLRKELVRNQECYKIELIAKEDAPVAWGKIVSWITTEGHNNWKSEYYDEEGYLIHTENAYNLMQMGDRIIPEKYEIIPEEEPGNKTILIFKNMVFDQNIDEGFFSIQNMKRIK